MKSNGLLLGIDVGTQGARAAVVDAVGNVKASKNIAFCEQNVASVPGQREQRPEDWWGAVLMAVRACVAEIGSQEAKNVVALSVDGTSGTVVALNRANEPASHGIMYNDSRSGPEAVRVRERAGELEKALGYRVNASFGLPKMIWLKEQCEGKVYRFVHQCDYVLGRFTGSFDVTDYSNALKSCYDLQNRRWPDFLSQLGIGVDQLPNVVAPGTVIGMVSRLVAEETGLPQSVKVVAGATDGYASAFSSGISDAGDWSTIIGTTFVLKGIEKELLVDPSGRIYSHMHPQGYWLLGGASNVGGHCLNEVLDGDAFETMNKRAQRLTPTGLACYPLMVKGERFPFLCPEAEGFLLAADVNKAVLYTARMEGVGYIERLAYETMESLGCRIGDRIFSSGGACKSSEWLQIRSDILSKTIQVPAHTGAVLGTAMIASLAVAYRDLAEASSAMVSIAQCIEPSYKAGLYEDSYQKTKDELTRRGYLA